MTTVLTDSSNLQGLYEHVKFITIQDSLKFKDFVRLTNFAIDAYTDIAMQSTTKWKFDSSTYTSKHPIATHDLKSGRNDYSLEVKHLGIDQVEANINGKWVKLTQIDRDDSDQPLATTYADNGNPQYFDFDGDSVWVYPAPSSDIDEGLKIYYVRPVEYVEVTDTNVLLGIPRIHYEYIALYAAHKLTFRTNDKMASSIKRELLEQEEKIKEFFSKRDKTRPRKLKGIINVAI